jgi:hydrogenase nickel incorporation protein HypA/HybF
MHELQIANQIVKTVNHETWKQAIGQVVSVTVRIGQLSGVDSAALAFSWSAATSETPLEGATLEIESTGLVGRCRSCEQEFVIDDHEFRCPLCGTSQIDLVQGQEIEVASFTIDEPDME